MDISPARLFRNFAGELFRANGRKSRPVNHRPICRDRGPGFLRLRGTRCGEMKLGKISDPRGGTGQLHIARLRRFLRFAGAAGDSLGTVTGSYLNYCVWHRVLVIFVSFLSRVPAIAGKWLANLPNIRIFQIYHLSRRFRIIWSKCLLRVRVLAIAVE